jgi:hypothetical protein
MEPGRVAGIELFSSTSAARWNGVAEGEALQGFAEFVIENQRYCWGIHGAAVLPV